MEMTDQEGDRPLEVPESEELPLPVASGDSGDERRSTVGAVNTTKLVKELVPALRDALVNDPEFVRQSQSVKDKRLRVLDDIDPAAMRKFSAYLKKYGDEEEAIRQTLIDHKLLGAVGEGPGTAAPVAEPVGGPAPR